ncbi:uncharacterized protein LOC130088018 [Rhinichthys klamathensis goyatoka]|nr:uncharacterized protein LOC130088018 [Rhinichthys klamathensis goyatoka]
MAKVNYIGTTTDCWTARQRSYIGVTAHWIDEPTLERRSASIAFRRLKGSHTFDLLAGTLVDIHSEYGISEKIVRTTTDSGSNFIKAFRVYGEQSQQELIDAEADSAEAVTLDDENDAEGFEVQDTSSIFNANSGLEYHLPKHQRCACHLLNLVATVDASKAEDSSEVFKKLSRSTFAKCQALYNKTSRSAISAEIVQEECKLQFIQPNHTRWNSVYNAAERVMRILKEQGEASLRNVCAAFKIKMLNPAEVSYLSEYCIVMKPVSMALNILQSETNTQMGWLLPTIYLLDSKLKKMEASVKVCLSLIHALQRGLQKRFGEFMEDPELISAAILLPKFKTSWTDKAHIIGAGMDYILHRLDAMKDTQENESQHVSDEDDFFSSIKTVSSTRASELDGYLACASEEMELLHSFPLVKKLSLKLNTPLPASAACERLFSCAGQLFTPRRARLDSTNFENQLIVKLNNKFKM